MLVVAEFRFPEAFFDFGNFVERKSKREAVQGILDLICLEVLRPKKLFKTLHPLRL